MSAWQAEIANANANANAVTDVFEVLQSGHEARDTAAICTLHLPDAMIFDLALAYRFVQLGVPTDEHEAVPFTMDCSNRALMHIVPATA